MEPDPMQKKMNLIFILLGCITIWLDIGKIACTWLVVLPFVGFFVDISAMRLKGFISPAFF